MNGNFELGELLDARTHSAGITDIRAAVLAIQTLLCRQLDFLNALTDDQYVLAPQPGCSGIGGHVRHALDHVRALLDGFDRGWIDYDQRERGTDVERSRASAVRQTQILLDELDALSGGVRDRRLRVRALVSAEGPTVTMPTSLGRELLFVLSHTTHHHALMALTARTIGAPVPVHFGSAPATIAFREAGNCAPSAS